MSGIILLLASTASMAQLVDGKVPQHTLIVKGAWSSSSDAVTPLPEGGTFTKGTYSNEYFGFSYSSSDKWTERVSGPPPSDSGYYVLAQVEPVDQPGGQIAGHLMIAAQDLFFSLTLADNAMEQVKYSRDHLAAGYVIDTAPTEVSIANHQFIRFDYSSPLIGLHWRILATEIRCHVVQFIFTSRDLKLIDKLSAALESMKFPSAQSGPVCLKNYAAIENRLEGDDPIFNSERYNPVPVRITIDAAGKVKQIHYLSAFPEQAAAISDVLSHWRLKPYLVNGEPVEVETGIMFGRVPTVMMPKRNGSSRHNTTALVTPNQDATTR